jgi:hypothetical protein
LFVVFVDKNITAEPLVKNYKRQEPEVQGLLKPILDFSLHGFRLSTQPESPLVLFLLASEICGVSTHMAALIRDTAPRSTPPTLATLGSASAIWQRVGWR